MPDNLYGEGASLLRSAGEGASQIASQRQKATDTTVQAGADAGRNLTTLSVERMKMINDQLDRQANMIEITPQLALGLVKNTGDKSWLQGVGTKMRADVYTALYTHGVNTRITGKEYDLLHEGKQYRMINEITDEGEVKPRILSIGNAPVSKTGVDTEKAQKDRESRERIAKEKSSTSASSKQDPKDKEFEKTYRQFQKDTEGMNYALLNQLTKKDPKQAGDMRSKLDFIEKNKDRFNRLQGTQSGGASIGTDDQKAVDYLRQNYPSLTNPTPQDIEWAKGKLRG